MVLAPDCSFWTESMRVVLGVVIEADIPTDDEEVVLTDPGDEVVADTLGELLALLLLLMMGLLWRYVMHSGSHQACRSRHHSPTGLFVIELLENKNNSKLLTLQCIH